jgi:hypothetical protein
MSVKKIHEYMVGTRLPKDLRDRLLEAARLSGRTVSHEVRLRIEKSFECRKEKETRLNNDL